MYLFIVCTCIFRRSLRVGHADVDHRNVVEVEEAVVVARRHPENARLSAAGWGEEVGGAPVPSRSTRPGQRQHGLRTTGTGMRVLILGWGGRPGAHSLSLDARVAASCGATETRDAEWAWTWPMGWHTTRGYRQAQGRVL